MNVLRASCAAALLARAALPSVACAPFYPTNETAKWVKAVKASGAKVD